MSWKIVETYTDDGYIVNFEDGTVFHKRLQRFCGWNCHGYLIFGLNRKNILNHRYIYNQYLLLNGEKELTDKQHINHKNGTKTDNRLENLEVVNHTENMRYTGKQKNNTSGYKNISKQKSGNWQVRIMIDRKNYRYGTYPLEQAIYVRNKAIEYLNKTFNYNYITEYPL